MTSGVSGSSSTGSTGSTDITGASSTSLGNTTVNKNMFLQLLVAQLRNQDPLNPADGTEFVGQLAQMQQMESTLNMGQDMTAIRSTLDQILASLNTATQA